MLLVRGFCFVGGCEESHKFVSPRVFVVGTLILVSPVVSLRACHSVWLLFPSLFVGHGEQLSTHNQQFVNL
jgi:hypothetical protein